MSWVIMQGLDDTVYTLLHCAGLEDILHAVRVYKMMDRKMRGTDWEI